MLKLNQINHIPTGLLELEKVSELHRIFEQPTLLHLEGKQKQPLFISVLLHANEDTGFFAVQALLKRYLTRELPRSLSIFFGNIAAAKQGVRRLENQPDYNRVWPSTEIEACDETRLMQQVVNIMVERQVFASIDVHNNTGRNPHYGCINRLDNAFLHLSMLFSRTVVFFETPKGVQSMAMSEHCPSVTIECGKPHLAHGVEHATNYLETVLHLDKINTQAIAKQDIDIYHTVARVTVPKSVSFQFLDNTQDEVSGVDICFESGFDKLNFRELSAGTIFGKVAFDNKPKLQAWDDHEQDVSDDFFVIDNEKILLKKAVMPAMITLDKAIIRQDCLCYLMERVNYYEAI